MSDPSAEIVFNPIAFLPKREYMRCFPAFPFTSVSARVNESGEDTLSISEPHTLREVSGVYTS